MSSPEKSEGNHHPTAVKVGGMRITQNKTHLKDKTKDTPVPQNEEEALKVSTSPPKSALTAVSGAVKKGDADFPKEAVQSFHDKPTPTHDKGAATKPIIIHQPRKQAMDQTITSTNQFFHISVIFTILVSSDKRTLPPTTDDNNEMDELKIKLTR